MTMPMRLMSTIAIAQGYESGPLDDVEDDNDILTPPGGWFNEGQLGVE